MTIEQAVQLAKKHQSLEGVVIDDLNETQVSAVDALALAECGIVVPEQNIFYSDTDITYDPDFDEVNWLEEPIRMTWEEKMEISKEIRRENESGEGEEISVKVNIADKEVRQWVLENYDKLGEIFGYFIVDIYRANKIIKE